MAVKRSGKECTEPESLANGRSGPFAKDSGLCWDGRIRIDIPTPFTQRGASMTRRPGVGIVVALACLARAVGAVPEEEPAAFRTKFPRDMLDRQPVLVAADVATPPTIDGEVDHDPVWAVLPSVSHTDGAWTQLARKEVSGRQTVQHTSRVQVS